MGVMKSQGGFNQRIVDEFNQSQLNCQKGEEPSEMRHGECPLVNNQNTTSSLDYNSLSELGRYMEYRFDKTKTDGVDIRNSRVS